MTSYLAGNLIATETDFTDPTSGDPVDPDAVTLTFGLRRSTASPTVLVFGQDDALVKLSAGKYQVLMDTSGFTGRADEWQYQWDGTGAHQASAVGGFVITGRPYPGPGGGLPDGVYGVSLYGSGVYGA